MLIVFTSKSSNTINIVSNRRVEPFRPIVAIDSNSGYKLFYPILDKFTNVAPHMFNIVRLKARREVRIA